MAIAATPAVKVTSPVWYDRKGQGGGGEESDTRWKHVTRGVWAENWTAEGRTIPLGADEHSGRKAAPAQRGRNTCGWRGRNSSNWSCDEGGVFSMRKATLAAAHNEPAHSGV